MSSFVITKVRAAGFTIRGVSVGGVYTSLKVDELGAVLDAGIALRSLASTDQLFLSHGHADHLGSLTTLLGIRALHGKSTPPKVHLPFEIAEHLHDELAASSRMQRYSLAIDAVPMKPGDELPYRNDMVVRAFRTHHPVPSLGYQFLRRIAKLKPEHLALPGDEIARRRKAGDDIFDVVEHLELAYATDTLARVLETTPSLLESRVLILECTFLDERKSLEATHQGCHIHLDEILERATLFKNEALVLMHFSQLYDPADVHAILERRCPRDLFERIVVFAPRSGRWPG
jgi:ribonuclease Z